MTQYSGEPVYRVKMPWGRWLAVAVCCLWAYLVFQPGKPTRSLSEKYPGVWSGAASVPISAALARHGARGCGEMYHRQAADSASEFLVYCSPDGRQWIGYLVWTISGDVMGPLKISNDIPPPR